MKNISGRFFRFPERGVLQKTTEKMDGCLDGGFENY